MLRCILLLIGVVIVSTINAVHVPSSFNDDPITNDDCMTKIFDQINVPQDEGRQLLAGSQMGITIDRAASESLSPSSILLLLIALYGQENQDNRFRDNVYKRLASYARLQARAEDPRVVDSLEEGLTSSTYQSLAAAVRNPSFQASLQAGLARNANRYNNMENQVRDPSYLANMQGSLYRSFFRPGPQDNERLSDQATSLEAAWQPRGHVP